MLLLWVLQLQDHLSKFDMVQKTAERLREHCILAVQLVLITLKILDFRGHGSYCPTFTAPTTHSHGL